MFLIGITARNVNISLVTVNQVGFRDGVKRLTPAPRREKYSNVCNWGCGPLSCSAALTFFFFSRNKTFIFFRLKKRKRERKRTLLVDGSTLAWWWNVPRCVHAWHWWTRNNGPFHTEIYYALVKAMSRCRLKTFVFCNNLSTPHLKI